MKRYYSENGITIYHGNCLEIIPTLEPVDMVLTDPPYGETSLHGESSIKLDCGKKGVTIPYADEKTGLVWPLLEAGCKIVE